MYSEKQNEESDTCAESNKSCDLTVEHNDTTGMIWWYHFAFQAYHKGALFYPQPLKHAMTWIEGGGVSGLDRDTQTIQMISLNSNLEGSNSMIKQLLMHPIVLISIRFLFFPHCLT